MVFSGASVVVRREFWLLVGGGLSASDAAVAVGVAGNTGRNWFRDAGGMRPAALAPPMIGPARRLAGALTVDEREQIAVGAALKLSIREIGRQLGRSHTTVRNELYRNRPRWNPAGYRAEFRPGAPGLAGRHPGPVQYSPSKAQARADRQARRPKPGKLVTDPRLRAQVEQRLEDKLSPEQISGRLRVEFPDDPEMRVSHETIYRSLYVQGKGGLKRELEKCLRTGRTVRKPRRSSSQRRPRGSGSRRIPDMINISDRPAEIEDRAIPGHWEGDLIIGKNSASAIGTLVDRTTGFVQLLHLPDNHGALAVQQAMITTMAALPATLRRSVTWDQGIEMANHLAIAEATDLDIYFCDPHAPWQRGTNENTNGLLRQYFPKGTDLSGYHPDYLDYVAAQLNNRPRKRYDYQTPLERLTQLLSQQATPPPGALTA